jgi:hypothetical protein
MVPVRLRRRTRARSLLAVACACIALTVMTQSAPSVANPTPATSEHGPHGGPGPMPVEPGRTEVPGPLPVMPGTIEVDEDLHIGSVATTAGGRVGSSAPAGITASAVAAVAPDRVAVRALVIGVDAGDFGVPTWKTMLDRVGATYDVLYVGATPLTADRLVDAAGIGRYNAILLTSSMLAQSADGAVVSALDAAEWNLLWSYERDYKVRQVALYSSHGAWPEDYCTRAGTEGSVGAAGVTATLTAAGAGVFDYLATTARIPVVESYVYRTTIAAGCSATPILQVGGAVLGVVSPSTDGRERAALTFTSNEHLLQSHLLTYGLFRWATRGLYFGEQRHYLTVDVDDWFNSSDHLYPDGHIETDPGFQMSAHDVYNTHIQQGALRKRYPLASEFKFHLAYNGGDADLTATPACYPNGTVAQMTATTRCLRLQFNWINHTVSHPELNSTDYATTRDEIARNFDIAKSLNLPADPTVLKTPEYSGLGVYNPNPDDDLGPPTDYGLMASNPALLRAAKDLGIKYLHGNMSFASHVPSCFNCSIVHPMEPSVQVVPDWPTNIAYFATTAAEETVFYNSFYGPNGRFPYWPSDRTYAQLLDYEASIGLTHVATGSIYTHTFHISNLRDYGSGRTLATDWVDAVMAKYSSYYRVPLRTPTWSALAKQTSVRNGHFAGLAAGAQAIYNRTTNSVSVTSPVVATVTLSGAKTANFSTYGNEVSALFALKAGRSVSFTPALRS